MFINDFLLKKLTSGDFLQSQEDQTNTFFYDSQNKFQNGKPIVGFIIEKFELQGSLIYKDILHNGIINKYDTNVFLYATQKTDYIDFRIIYMTQNPDFNKQNKLVIINNGNIKTQVDFEISKIDYVNESSINWFNLNNQIYETFNRSIYDFYNWLKSEVKIDASFEKL